MTESENRRCAVVTGSTRGIGRAVARELAAAGMNVVVNSSSERSLPAAEAVAAEIAEEFGVETLAVAANVAIEEEANALIAAAAEANGRVDVLVNNAGICHYGLLSQITQAQWDRLFAVNVGGIYHCVNAVLPAMLRSASLMISSTGSVPSILETASAASLWL